MQYWIFYWGGVGGDGFSNFLEHADNIEPSDGNLTWRILDSTKEDIKFENPEWSSDSRFFRHHPRGFNPNIITLNPTYVNLVDTGVNTVIPIHPWWYMKTIASHPAADILTKDIHRIFLYSTDTERVIKDFFNKTETPTVKDKYSVAFHYRRFPMLDPSSNDIPLDYFDTLIDIEKVWRDWDYTSKTLSDIGINMSRECYEEYLTVSKRRYL